MADYQVKPLLPEQRPALTQFYKRNHYKGKVKATDNVWLMTKGDDQIIGAARLCQQGGLMLLRGVWIERALRAQGLGSQLLRYLKCAGVLEGCYCFAYLHLEAFYSKLGFCRVASVPASLHSALERYNRPAVQVLLMVQQQ
ncbi:GNAT family N-acetyltransferase [Neptunomonas sp.]|uniref:GNAT family N-acetyltransferase n=1 Tax=Neptunomonas sp. TaxID=1971898 RepID=UPI00356818CA